MGRKKILKVQRAPKKTKELKPKGRPKESTVIDDECLDKVYILSQFQMPRCEIYSFLGILEMELSNNKELKEKFENAYKAGLEAGKAQMRMDQIKYARKGNAPLLIWIGKQYLKQSDNPIENNISNELGTLKVEFVNSQNESQEERLKRIEDDLDKELK